MMMKSISSRSGFPERASTASVPRAEPGAGDVVSLGASFPRGLAVAALAASGAAVISPALAGEMVCTPVANSASVLCTAVGASAAAAQGSLSAAVLHGAVSVGQAAGVGAVLLGAAGFVAGVNMGGLPDGARDPVGAGLLLASVGAVAGGAFGAVLGCAGLLF